MQRVNDFLTAEAIDWVTCFDIGLNGGFAYGNNYIVENHVLPDPTFDHVHFLNPDAYIRPGAVKHLLEFLTAHPEVGVAGSRLENPDGSPRAYGFNFPTPTREFFRGAKLSILDRLFPNASIKIENLMETREVDWVTGASFMMPRCVLDEVGLMDARYFLYFEEVDLMYRVRRAGHAIWHVAESRVVHLAGQATGIREGKTVARPMPLYWYQSRYKFFRDQYGLFGAVFANIAYIAGDLLNRLGKLVRGRPVTDPSNPLRNFLMHGFTMPPDRSY